MKEEYVSMTPTFEGEQKGFCSPEKNIFNEWLDFAIENQEGLKKENEPMPFPEWNKGYLEALLDAKKFIVK